MSQELPKAYEPALIEEKWSKFWVDERIFDVPTPGENPGAPHLASEMWDPSQHKPFVQLLPPPNVTGRLHMGHMLNQTEMDILARWHRMSGDTAVWVPGTDHAGIATQMMVERQLASEGTTSRQELGREAFTERVWAWKRKYGSAITDQMRRLGASVDWSREYFTMDERLSRAVREAFVRLWEQGLIYRGAYIVNWDPVLLTAVSDLEVENEERAGHLYHIRYLLADGPLPDGPLGGQNSIVIATTRPETMLGDVAVAVNPNDARYTHLIGKKLILPLSAAAGAPDREIPILADDWANPEFGTGAVKVTPAHDPNDFAIGQRHNLPSPSIMDERARISLEGSPYHGLDRFEARKRIVTDLEAAGHLVAVKDHALTLPVSQRTGAVIEPRLSMQWFLAVNKTPSIPATPGAPCPESGTWAGAPQKPTPTQTSIAANAIAAVRDGHIKFTPEMYAKTYFEWMNNIHDWCISRQLWWGHRIPAWHCGACGQINVSRDVPASCTKCSSASLTQETDVLDTWFSSGLLPFTAFGWPGDSKNCHPERRRDPQRGFFARWGASEGSASPAATNTDGLTPDLAAFYPTDLLVTGFDILFFWVARMIMLGCHLMADVPMTDGRARTLAETVPFKHVYIHGLIRDADRQKMSKTKGNVIDPIEIITKYGTDAVRFTLASQASPGTDIAFNEARTEGYRAFANKIWNAARFIQMNIDRGRAAGYTVSLIPRTEPGAPCPDSGSWDGAVHTPLETRWIFSRLSTVSTEIHKSLAAYRFDEAANAVYQFFWGEFCDWYLELVKLRLDFDSIPDTNLSSRPKPSQSHREGAAERPAAASATNTTALTLNALVTVFEAALRLLSPFMPFLTEELWHALYASIAQPSPAKSIALTRYPQAADFVSDEHSVRGMNRVQSLIVAVRSRRKELGVPEKESTPILAIWDAGSGMGSTNPAINNVYKENQDMISRLARVSHIEDMNFTDLERNPELGWIQAGGPFFSITYARQIDVLAERERLTKDLAKFNKGLEAADKQLNNSGFISRAPAHIVEGLRKQHAETLALRQKAEAALAALPSNS